MKKAIILLYLFSLSVTGVSQEDWKLQRNKADIKVWTKDYPNSKFKQFKAKTIIKAELENVVAVFLDIQNMSVWYDRVEQVDLVEKVSEMEGIYKIDFELPWPVADRISAVRAVLNHDPFTNVVTVHTKYEPGIITNPDRLLVTQMHSEWILTPLEGGYVDIYHHGFMDPAGSIPAWIANSGVKDGPVITLKNLKKILPEYKKVDVPFID